MVKYFVLAALSWCLMFVAPGCAPESSIALKPSAAGDGPETKAVPGSGTTDPNPGPKEPIKPPDMDLPIPKGAFDIPPANKVTEKPAAISLAELGKKMDKAWFSSGELLCESDTIFEVDGAKGSGKAKIKVQDSKTFSVEYYMPETAATVNRVIADGKDKISYFKDGYKFVPNTGLTGKAIGNTSVAEFAKTFNRTMFAAFELGQDVWGPLFANWQNGYEGAKATVQESKHDDRLEYRIIAEDGKGAQVDVRIDGKHYLPVAIRSVVTTGTHKDSRLWDATWNMGGHHQPKDFVLPKRDVSNR